jgi:phospholipid-binding lipoprotein MlaA
LKALAPLLTSLLLLAAAGAPAQVAEPQTDAMAPASELPDDDEWLFDQGPDPAERDDIECTNRLSFRFNESFYYWVADPIAKGFAWLVPAPGRRAVHRFFENLESPALFLSDLFQLAPLDASKTGGRFVINSTLGIAGLLDVADVLGIEGHHTDFGETLAVWGTPSGSYVVIPVLGPSTARDTFGQIVDAALHPTAWILTPAQQLLIRSSDGLSTYDLERERLDALRATSVDFYAAIRGAYLLDRDAHVQKRLEGRWWHKQAAEPQTRSEVRGSAPPAP